MAGLANCLQAVPEAGAHRVGTAGWDGGGEIVPSAVAAFAYVGESMNLTPVLVFDLVLSGPLLIPTVPALYAVTCAVVGAASLFAKRTAMAVLALAPKPVGELFGNAFRPAPEPAWKDVNVALDVPDGPISPKPASWNRARVRRVTTLHPE